MNVAEQRPAANGTIAGSPSVVIGGKNYLIVPQRVGRLKKRLKREFETLSDIGGREVTGILDLGLEKAHGILAVFIPELMPLHEFLGFRSQEEMDDEDAEEHDDLGATVPEIDYAIRICLKVNRFDLAGALGKLISPDLIRAFLNKQVSDLIMGTMEEPTTTSPSTSATPGLATPSTTSGTTPPTSEMNEV